MYTEIIKIIEGGLSGDKEKVFNYASVLASNLKKQNELTMSTRIENLLAQKKPKSFVTVDSLASKPVDTESRMDIVSISYPDNTFSELILPKTVKDEIQEFIESFRRKDDLLRAGIEMNNNLLLYGPPGCGKTTVAEVISSMTKLPLITAQLDGLVSSLLGSTAKNLRKIFDFASTRECILFLDEFDVIAKLRDDKNELGELKRVVNSLIQNIDNLPSTTILVAATNHQDLLDSAIWRRFSKVVNLELPRENEIEELLKLYLGNQDNAILGNEKRTLQICKALEGLSHSDIKTITNNALKRGILSQKKCLSASDELKEIFLFRNHAIDDEKRFVNFLLDNGATQKEISEEQGIPIRKIQVAIKEKN